MRIIKLFEEYNKGYSLVKKDITGLWTEPMSLILFDINKLEKVLNILVNIEFINKLLRLRILSYFKLKNFSKNKKIKIFSDVSIKVFKNSSKYHLSISDEGSITVSNDKEYFIIYFCEDDYYYISYRYKRNFSYFYKCDQKNGLKKFLKDIKNELI